MCHAVLTGILSSRWRGLRAHTQSLDFDESRHYGINEYTDIRPFYLFHRDDFLNFVEHSLVLHLSCKIHKFRLCFGFRNEYNRYIDGCESLISLYLKACDVVVPNSVCFSSLVSLVMSQGCHLSVSPSNTALIEAPNLQNLESLWFRNGNYHVNVLKLSCFCIEVMSFSRIEPSYISKTQCLILESELRRSELPGMANFFCRSHDLENLVIKLIPSRFVSLDLKSTEVVFEEETWEWLKFPFPCMKLITIQFCEKPDFVKEEEWLKILLMVTQKLTANIPRASCAELSHV
ncbi:hypothetical protein MRB53_035793 [Persea americana]|uniref:Uncharacterized protein n=1 Tax=Persea americana TaxID=3435 RepID=A0ACC2K5M5_PERAE|nr:hypothetical protein MRB53_035793 [Persea americana]